MDVFRATDGQIWIIGEGQDKFNREEDDNVLSGKRPGLIIRSSGTNCLVIPFSTSLRYSALCSPINIGNDVNSYPAIDCAQTISAYHLNEYRATMKPISYNKIVKAFVDYCMGYIQYSSSAEKYIYTQSRPNGTVRPVTYTGDEPSHIKEDDGGTDITKRHYRKRSVDDKLFILTHSPEEIHDEFGMSISYAKITKRRYMNELSIEKDLSKYNAAEVRAIRNNTVEELMNTTSLDELSIKYLKHMFIRESK